ncbi:hypothetical protein [Rothia dentocariosa]|uniref:hypothetical protein n=1 Tax=Rothia dentocariosa TaxID=2047 RepID=UPI0028EFEB21|nr:hypothetical protein [Rothia dentocariosa]
MPNRLEAAYPANTMTGHAAFVYRFIRYLNTTYEQHRGSKAFRYSGDGITNL